MPAAEPHRRRFRRPSRRATKRLLIGGLVLILLVAGGLYVAARHLEGNITVLNINGDLGKRPARKVVGPINVLVMGDDTRTGQGPSIGGVSPGLSDTTILLHLSANRKFAYGVSLPRDAIVQRPSCVTKKGVAQAGTTQFNEAYAIGGPGCTMKTVEQLTRVRLDHFVVVRFRGFRKMVDAIGGVQVCLPEAVDDNTGHIHLRAGTYDVNGDQALDYVRERHGIGDGSDVGRMKRQQAFIASMINKVVSAGTLANPVRLYRFLNETTKSLITDPGFSHLGDLVSLGSSLKSIGLDHVKFVTVPFRPYPTDPNRLEWAPRADRLWRLIRLDKPLTKEFGGVVSAAKPPGGASKSAGPSPSSSPSSSASPSQSPSPSPTSSEDLAQYGLCS